jgi:hypothetical protein
LEVGNGAEPAMATKKNTELALLKNIIAKLLRVISPFS